MQIETETRNLRHRMIKIKRVQKKIKLQHVGTIPRGIARVYKCIYHEFSLAVL